MAATVGGATGGGGAGMTRTEVLTSAQPAPQVVIETSRGWIGLKLRELWDYRELLYFLDWREVKVRYKQTVIGAECAIIQLLFYLFLFTVSFWTVAHMSD